jgi:hypothetical protein
MTTSESVGHSKTCSLWLQKSPSRNFWKMAEILSTFQRSFFSREPVIAGTFVGIARKDVDILLRSQKHTFQCRSGHHRILFLG